MIRNLFSSLSKSISGPRRRARATGSGVPAEALERRAFPTVMFTPTVAAPTVTDGGGQVLKDTPVYLIYWGSQWGTSTTGPTMQSINEATRSMLDGPYLSFLEQYRPGLGKARFAGSVWDSSNPVSGFSTGTLLDRVQNAYNELGLPDPDDIEPTIPLYLVVTPPGIRSGQGSGVLGYHTWVDEAHDEFLDSDDVYYGWIGNDGTQDFVTSVMSHEVVESLTNPKLSGGITATTGGSGEISDGNAQSFNYRVNGVLLQSYWSARDGHYVVPDGNDQRVVVNNGTLSVWGDQRLSDFDPNSAKDRISIAASGNRISVDQNGGLFLFEPGQITSVIASGLSGDDEIQVSRTLQNVPVTVNGGAGSDRVIVGSGSLDALFGRVTVNGASDGDVMYVLDNLNAFDDQYTVTSSSITKNSLGSTAWTRTVSYSGLGAVSLVGSRGNNQISILGLASGTNYEVNGGNGIDTLVGRAVNETWSITSANAGNVGKVGFLSMENLKGNILNDVFSFGNLGSISGRINGGSGDNWLDYSGRTGTTGVTVNLATGTATSVGGGTTAAISSIQNVRGSRNSDTLTGDGFANILVGMAGNDVLNGAGGRDLLFGGYGADTLNGGASIISGDRSGDLLIGGHTSHDLNNTALVALRREWDSAGDYNSRVGNIVSGASATRLNGSFRLNSSTVFDDGTVDFLTGGLGTDLDLFFAKVGDRFDLTAGEFVL